MNTSIKRNLLWSIIFTLLIALLINSVLSHIIARNEVDEVFDAELLTIARIIRGVIDTPQLERNAIEIGHALEETLSNNDKAPNELKNYEKKILLQVWKKDGSQMLFHSANAPEFAMAPLEKGFYYHDKNNSSWIVYVTPLSKSNNWLLVGEIPQARNELSNDLVGVFIISGTLALLFCSLIVLTVIDVSLRPLQTLRGLLRNRTLKKLTPIELNPMPKELEPVVSSINHLFTRLNQGIAKEQQFVADAAHELRTPLAVMKLRTQHLQQKAGPELQDDLKRLEESVSRSHHVVEQLLLLARLDNQKHDTNLLETDVVELTRRTMAELWPKAEHYKTTLSFNSDVEHATKLINPTLLDIAIHNLVSNAIRYSPVDTEVTVSLTTDSGLSINIADQGAGVSNEELQRLSERFYRAQGQERPGAGLGLAIVRQVCDQIGAVLEFKNRDEGGFMVSIQFPQK